MALTFDTHQFIKTLEAAGMPLQQAEAISKAIRDAQSDLDTNVATKADIKEVLLLIKGLYVAGIFGFAVLGWLCVQVFEMSKHLP